MLPNFLIAGSLAAGTSFLSATLTRHPDIYLPRIQRPEPNFFHYSWKYDQGLDWYQKTWFSEFAGQRAAGERSSLLLSSPIAPRRIKDALPDVKLIFCLRNPLERAWGNYRFTVLEGLESLSFEDAIDQEERRSAAAVGRWSEVKPHAYVERSRYSAGLGEYIRLFGRNNILLLKSEDLGRHPQENVARVCDFLGVDSSVHLEPASDYSSPSVVDHKLQAEMRSYFGDRFSDIVEAIRREESLSSFRLSDNDLKTIATLKANLMARKEPMPPIARERLRELLRTELLHLRRLVDFSVDDWN